MRCEPVCVARAAGELTARGAAAGAEEAAELGVRAVIDAGLAQAMEEIFAVDESNCWELTLAEWEARDVYRRFTEMVLNPLRPLR